MRPLLLVSAMVLKMNSDPCLVWSFSQLLIGTRANTEVAAFVIQDSNGWRLLIWPRRAWGLSQAFRGPIPDGTVAIVHTHFVNEDHASSDDVTESIRLQLPFYVVTRSAVWVFDPESRQHMQVAGGHTWIHVPSRPPNENCPAPRRLRQ